MAATYMSQMPAGASTKTFVHFAQVSLIPFAIFSHPGDGHEPLTLG